jgi:hypothetical protein
MLTAASHNEEMEKESAAFVDNVDMKKIYRCKTSCKGRRATAAGVAANRSNINIRQQKALEHTFGVHHLTRIL